MSDFENLNKKRKGERKMSTATLVVLVSIGGIIVIGIVIINKLFAENKHLKNLLQAYGLEILELEKEKVRTQTEVQCSTTQTARSTAEDNALQSEIKKKNRVDQVAKTIESEIEREKKLDQLLVERGKNTTIEIQERQAKIDAGIDPDRVPPAPKTCLEKISDYLQKHWFLSFVVLIILIIILNAI
ncbi:MAG: hypothetical protein V1667_00645 [bacterium]